MAWPTTAISAPAIPLTHLCLWLLFSGLRFSPLSTSVFQFDRSLLSLPLPELKESLVACVEDQNTASITLLQNIRFDIKHVDVTSRCSVLERASILQG